MPNDTDDNIEDLQPSEQVNDVTDATETTDAKAEDVAEAGAADPSPAEDEKPEDVLSVVRNVVSKSEEPADPSAAKEDQAEEGTAEQAATEAAEQDDTDYSDVPFHKHPRFQQLLQKAKTNEADAGRYRNVESFLTENRLTADEAADGLRIMALMKTDPTRALEMLKPHVQNLLVATGEVLPADLKARVQSGELPAGAALEISRSRAVAEQQQRTREADDAHRQQQQTALMSRQRVDAANAWLSDRDQRDPSFQSKYPLLQREVAFLQRSEGVPQTAEAVRDQLNRAYESVNQQARVVAPAITQKPAIRPVTGGAAPGKPAPQPQSMIDVIRQARGA